MRSAAGRGGEPAARAGLLSRIRGPIDQPAAVPRADGGELGQVRWPLQSGEVGGLLGEQLLDPAGHGYPEETHRAGGDIGEGVRDLPGHPRETARAQFVAVLADLEQQAAFDYVKTLVAVLVEVQRRARRPWPQHPLGHREQAAGVRRPDLDRGEGARAAASLVRREHIGCRSLVHETLLVAGPAGKANPSRA